MGIVTSKPQEAQERPQVGWGTPIEPAAAMLAVNRVPYEAYRGLRSYLSWRSLVSLLALALFIYGAYLIHLWHWQGKRAVIARLPARQIALCLLASFLIHLGTIVAILVAQQRLVLEVEQGNLAEVGLLDVGEEGGSGIPIAAPQPMAAPTVAPRPVAQRAPVQQVDISGLEEKAEQAIKEIGEKVTQADAQSAAAEGAAHEGVVAGARAGVGQRGQARRGLQANLQDLLDKLAEASKAKSGGPGGSAGDDEIFARRARWTLNIPHGINFYEFIDRYGAELATWSAKTPETLRYLSNLTGGLSMRTGLVSQEPRYHWAPIGVDIHRDGEVALFRKAGWHVGWDDPIVIFFPESFEQLLIKLEKDFRERAGMRKKPRSTIFEVQPDLGIIVLESK